MNDDDFHLLKALAWSLRKEAKEQEHAGLAATMVADAAGFLFEQVHKAGDDVVIGKPADYAAALRRVADRIDNTPTHGES